LHTPLNSPQNLSSEEEGGLAFLLMGP
jgi:hypothetical protein